MKTRLSLLALTAALSLSACNQEDHTIVTGGPVDPMANQLANAAPVELPPSILDTKSYRCADNSVIYIDWLSNGAARIKKSAREVGGTEIAAGSPELTGDAKSATVTYAGKTCKG